MKRWQIKIGSTIYYVYAPDQDRALEKIMYAAEIQEAPEPEHYNVIDERKAPGA